MAKSKAEAADHCAEQLLCGLRVLWRSVSDSQSPSYAPECMLMHAETQFDLMIEQVEKRSLARVKDRLIAKIAQLQAELQSKENA